MRAILFGLAGCLLFVQAGCKTVPPAPTQAGGAKIQMLVLSDRGDAGTMNPRQFQYRQELGQWMESDLIRILTKSGYDARLIQKQSEFTPAAGRYLLTVKIDSYNPGSTAARMMVGYGAGSASLNNSYALYGSETNAILTWKDGCGTSEHWSRLPRKLNENTVKKISATLSGR